MREAEPPCAMVGQEFPCVPSETKRTLRAMHCATCNVPLALAAHIGLGRVGLVLVVFAVLLIASNVGATRRHNQRAIERMRKQQGSRW
jgi:hypothetical protein